MQTDIMYIQQNTPQITIHLLYIDTIQQVNCDILYTQQLEHDFMHTNETGCMLKYTAQK
jgi:hypothetical protein